MKKTIIGLLAFMFLLIAGLVVVPGIIDWNSYKSEIAEQVRKATGRELIIAGDIEMTLLPKPALSAENVSLGSVEGASEPDLVALRSVEVRIALAPLLGGNIRIETVRLVEPRVYLEVLSDGRTTWSFDTIGAAQSPDQGVETSQSAGDASGLGVILDSFEIVDGTLSYSDAATNTQETVKDIDVNIVAASLTSGPFQIFGSLVARDMRLGIDADVGEIVGGRTFPLNLSLGVGGDSARLGLTGTVIGLDAEPRYRGDFSVRSENIGNLVSAVAAGASLPAALGQQLDISGQLDASASQVAVDELALNFGGATGTGSISGSLNGVPRVAAELRIDVVDADPWLKSALPEQATPGTGTPPSDQSASAQLPPGGSATASTFTLPNNLDASVVLRIGEVRMRGNRATDVLVDAALGNGEMTLNQFSLNAPGGTSAQLFGFLTAQDGQPAFDGELSAEISDVPTLLDWADVRIAGLQPGKPENLRLKTAVSGLGQSIAVKELDLNVDDTTVRGAANVALGARLGIGASINVDQIDLDQYLPDERADAQPSPSEGGQGDTADAQPADTPAPELDLAGMLRPLATFDANVRAAVGSLTYQGIPVSGIDAEISLANGALSISNLSVKDALTVAASVQGDVTDLAALPAAKGLRLRAEIGDPAGLAQFFGVEIPIDARNLGKVAGNVTVDGSLLAPALQGDVNALAGSVSFDGRVSPLTPASLFDMGVRLRHDDAANLLRRLGVTYRPSGNIGALDLAANVAGGPAAMSFKDMVASVGAARIVGAGTADLSGVRPSLVLNAESSGPLIVDPFIPAQQTGRLQNRSRIIPVRYNIQDGVSPLLRFVSGVSPRWARTPIDLSVLNAVDANLTFNAPSVRYQAYDLTDASLKAALSNGTLNISELAASVFGGAFQSTATVDARSARPALAAMLTLGDMDIGSAARAVGVDGASGRLTTRVDVTSAGDNLADWVQALNGQGAFQVNGVKARRSLADVPIIGVTFGPLLQIFELLNSGLGSIIGRGAQTGLGETDITSTFNIANGIVSTRDMRILSNIYNGNIAGDISLPAWQMDVSGNIAVDQGVVGALLAGVARLPNQIPFTVKGDIDNPKVNLQGFGSGAGGGVIPIPGLDRLEEKVPGVGGLLQGILGGGAGGTSSGQGGTTTAPPSQQPSPQQPPSQQPPAQQPQPQRVNPAEQLLRGILGN